MVALHSPAALPMVSFSHDTLVDVDDHLIVTHESNEVHRGVLPLELGRGTVLVGSYWLD